MDGFTLAFLWMSKLLYLRNDRQNVNDLALNEQYYIRKVSF